MTAATYNVFGELTGVTLGSGDSDTYTYDANTGRMTQYQFAINGSNVTGALTWNPNGTLQKLAITDPFDASNAQTCTYQYDPIARLSQANCGTIWGQNFTYDAYGNLTKNVITGDGGVAWIPMYNNNNQYTLTGTHYDSDGNLTNDTFHSYTWDAFGGVTAIDSTTITHDAFGRIVEFKGTTTRQFLYAPSGINLAKMNGQTLDTARVPLPGGGIADYHASGFNAYGHGDWVGTTRFGSTSTRTKDGDWAVAPFGETYAGGTASYSAFTGKFDDIATLLWDFPGREYHSTQGRWISPDPAGLAAVYPMNPQTWNRYAYVANNPQSFVDPTGLVRTPWGAFPDGGGMGESWDVLGMITGSIECENGDCGTLSPINGLAFLLWWSGRYTGLPTNLNNALWNALKALRSKQLSSKCQNKILGPLGVSQQQFQSYVSGPTNFYNGPETTVSAYGTIESGFWAWINQTSADTVASHFGPGDEAITKPGSSPFTVFVNPSFIDTSGFGANVDNEAMLFHEALHGITGFNDPTLQLNLLGPSGVNAKNTRNITDAIIDQCF